MKEGVSIDNRLNWFNEIIIELKNMKIEINNKDQILILLCSLPLSYAHFVKTLICGHDSISIEIVKLSVNSSEMRKRIMEGDSAGHSNWKTLVVHGRSVQKYNGSSSHQKKKSRSKSKIKITNAMLLLWENGLY